MSHRKTVAARGRGAILAGLLASTMWVSAAAAQERTFVFDLPSEPLADALRDYGKAADRQLIFAPELVRGRAAPAVRGRYTAPKALDLLLAGTELTWKSAPSGGIMIVRRVDAGPPAPAATANALAEPPRSLEEVVVTGTRIQGEAPVGARPTVISRSEIELSGRATAAELLARVPQVTTLGSGEEVRAAFQAGPTNLSFASSVNLRGLGVDATLTLIDSHRVASSNDGGLVDVSQIPLLGVERVEVLADGASAIYGSDAVAGVVNFVLRRDLDGAESFARYGQADGFHQINLGQALGKTWRGGQIFAAAEYFKQSPLEASKRGFYTDDLRAFGGSDLRTNNGVPGTIVVGGVTYAIPAGQNGRGLTPAQLIAGTANKANRWADADILPRTEKISGVLTFRQDLGDRLSVFFDAIGARREALRRDIASTSTLTVPRSNPFFVNPNPAATSTTVLYNFAGDWGPTAPNITAHDISFHGGLDVELPWMWTATASGLASRSWYNFYYQTLPNSTLVNQALADPNPATAFNPFGDRGSNPQSVLDRVHGFISQRHRLSMQSAHLDAAGPVFDLPAGSVKLAVGGETRREHLYFYSPRFLSGTAPTVASITDVTRHLDALYAEARAPIVSGDAPWPFAHSLTLSAAVRWERYSDLGSTTNPKLGVEWGVRPDLSFRASWGSSFKAPNLMQSQTNANTISVSALALPTGVVNVISLGGVETGLRPEKAHTWTIGVHYEPAWLPGFRADFVYFDVNYRDRILRPSALELIGALTSSGPSPLVIERSPAAATVLGLYANPLFLPTSSRPPPSTIFAVINNRLANLGRVEESGFDVSFDYDRETPWGDLGIGLDITRIDTYRVTRVAGQTALDALSTTNAPVDLRARLDSRWRRGDWSAGFSVNYTGDYRNTTVAPAQRVPDWTTVDAHIGYAVSLGGLEGLRVQLDARNLFDRDPPAVANVAGPFGYDPEQANAIGRVVAVTLRKTW
jgi:iron complex outermembrane receptor protein